MQESQLDAAALARNALAALAGGDAGRARDLLEQIVAAGRADASIWLMLARARAKLGDAPGKAAALDQAYALDPRGLEVLLARGDHLSELGDKRGASAFYSAALRYGARYAQLPPHQQEGLRRAKAWTDRAAAELEDFLRAHLDRSGFGQKQAPARFDRAVDILVGKKRAYAQNPRYFFYPELPQIQFYPRAMFPWLDRVEAATAAIRADLERAIADTGQFAPYLALDPNRPQGAQKGLAGNPNWGAYFMVKDGAEQAGAKVCPSVMDALAEAPLTDIPNRAPSVLFSKLAAGAHIPPHTGMINARLICHLPLIVPNDCALRVGNEIGVWEEGKAWAFDDSIEHEAWNRSDRDRYILLFDVWRPELSPEERAAVTALCGAIDAYGGAGAWDA